MSKLRVHGSSVEGSVSEMFVSVAAGRVVARHVEHRPVEAVVQRVLGAAELFDSNAVQKT